MKTKKTTATVKELNLRIPMAAWKRMTKLAREKLSIPEEAIPAIIEKDLQTEGWGDDAETWTAFYVYPDKSTAHRVAMWFLKAYPGTKSIEVRYRQGRRTVTEEFKTPATLVLPWSEVETQRWLDANPLPADFLWVRAESSNCGAGRLAPVQPVHRLAHGYGRWLRETPYFPGLFDRCHGALLAWSGIRDLPLDGIELARHLAKQRPANGPC